jgi:hypothetical protein
MSGAIARGADAKTDGSQNVGMGGIATGPSIGGMLGAGTKASGQTSGVRYGSNQLGTWLFAECVVCFCVVGRCQAWVGKRPTSMLMNK